MIKELLNKYPPNRDQLLMILHDIQNNRPDNYISVSDMKEVADYLNLTLSSVYGVVKYYSMFSEEPRGKYIIRLCKSPVCRMKGTFDVLNTLEKMLDVEMGETTHDKLFTLEASECLGQCDNAPVMMINEKLYKNIDAYKLSNIIRSIRSNQNQ
jgi:NADH-quinone oxidoreductase E subunit